VPAHNRFRSNDEERLLPLRPQPTDGNPEERHAIHAATRDEALSVGPSRAQAESLPEFNEGLIIALYLWAVSDFSSYTNQ
jgi:hypothetical protein